MRTTQSRNSNPNESAFLGLFEGKKKQREADAKAKLLEAEKEKELALIEAKNKQLLLQLEAAKQGYDPVKDKAAADLEAAKVQQLPEQTLYIMVAVVIAIVMVAVVLIRRKK